MKKNNYDVYIVTNGRAHSQKTYELLKKCGYTGEIYLVCDNLDIQLEEYKEIYGSKVVVFDKLKYIKNTDTFDNFNNINGVVFARNFCFDLAKKHNVEAFIMLDDDLDDICFRYIESGKLKRKECNHLDKVFNFFIDFLQNQKIATLTFGAPADYYGGANGNIKNGFRSNLCQVMFCKTRCKTRFRSIVLEDAVYVPDCATKGMLCLSIPIISQSSSALGTNSGGIHNLYKSLNSYVIHFYSVMAHPSCIKINKNLTITRNNNCMIPKVLSERWKKC